ncbi:MAG: molybdate ABC transporter permease subunit [Thermoflexaceae bacterium]|nr:molybdate ABC transporter permease subunit [Thermoflexaceae bacterium]
MDFSPLWISVKVAVTATIFTFFLGLLAARLVISMKRGASLVDGIFTLPMVLPPTVVGFFLMIIFGKNSILGNFLGKLGISVLFTWQGAVIAAVVVSFPIMYRTARGAFEQVDRNLIHAARTLGMSEWEIFFKVMLPVSWPGVAAATILAFARALGEFGATIMLAGNIPKKTQTMSVAIYTAVQSGNRSLAYVWVGIIMAISFLTIILMNYWTAYQTRMMKQGRKEKE